MPTIRIAPSCPWNAPSQAVWASVSIWKDAKGWGRDIRRSTALFWPAPAAPSPTWIRARSLSLQSTLSRGGTTGRQDRAPDQFGIEADIGGPARALSQQGAVAVAQPRPAPGSTSIDAEKQGFTHREASWLGPVGGRSCHLHNAT